MINVPENDSNKDGARLENFVSKILEIFKGGSEIASLYVVSSGITEMEARKVASVFLAKKYHAALGFLTQHGFNELIVSKFPICDSRALLAWKEILG